ncbi:hypothetical protein F4775DRAFT_606762 [Biscogniauxia sp. FL1348]|nr:hypothetical protein F4775DRAFT_606762 [Biscogniauxia sp. FL1348]
MADPSRILKSRVISASLRLFGWKMRRPANRLDDAELGQRVDGSDLRFSRLARSVQPDEMNYTNLASPPGGPPSQGSPKMMAFVPTTKAFRDSGYDSAGADMSKLQDQSEQVHMQSIEELNEPASRLGPGSVPSDAGENALETATIYSDTESLRDPRINEYVSEFAEELCSAIPREFDSQDLANVSLALPDLLKAFAIRLGSEQIIGHIHRIYKHRDEEDDERSQIDMGMAYNDKVSNWLPTAEEGLDNLEGDLYGHHNFHNDFYDAVGVNEEDLPGLFEYRAIIHQAPACGWLRACIRAEGLLEVPGEKTARDMIRDCVLKKIGCPKRISRKVSSDMHAIRFEVDWNPHAFFHEQQYTQSPSEILAGAITLTGSGNNVQAATCLQYLEQTWPETGPQVLSLLQQLLGGGKSQPTITLADKTQITAEYIDSLVSVMVVGNVYSVVEVGEQLGWLGAALRSSHLDQGVAYCEAVVSEFTQDPAADITGVCKLEFRVVAAYQDGYLQESGSGSVTCWHNLFRNPVVVTGYPIPRREKPDSGLLIPLYMIAALMNSQRLVDFCGRTFVKGFSAFIAATEVVGDTVFWHLFFNKDGDYISYEDPRVPRVQNVPLIVTSEALERSSHILGWCKEVNNHTGTTGANYDIDWSCLTKPNQSCAFEKVSISGGRYISAGVSLAIGIKDKPIHIHFGDDFNRMLSVIGQRHFVFYDVEDRRAWLVDGASGLLHLLRASIRQLRNEYEAHSKFLLADDQFEEACTAHTGSAAARSFLLNESNQNLRLYVKSRETWTEITTQAKDGKQEEVTKEKVTYLCVKDRVEQICNVLAQMIAHQDDVHTQAGVGFRLRHTPLQQLEGFDFMDVATNQGTLWPKVSELHQVGAGWAGFTRAIHALAFFGTGFGELFEPVGREGECRSCLWNHSVPKGQDYLVACVAELEGILKRNGDVKTQPWRLIDKIYWHTPGKSFEPCKCSPTLSTEHSRVQILSSSSHRLLRQCLKSPGVLATKGAVIFGHNRNLSALFMLRDARKKRAGDSSAAEDDDTDFCDSGIEASHSALDAMANTPSADTTALRAPGNHPVHRHQEILSDQRSSSERWQTGEISPPERWERPPDSALGPKEPASERLENEAESKAFSKWEEINRGLKGKQKADSTTLTYHNEEGGDTVVPSKSTTEKPKGLTRKQLVNFKWRDNILYKWFKRLQEDGL